MKNYFFIAALLVYTCSMYGQSAKSPASTDFSKLDWLEGTWTRTNSTPGRSGQEQWTRISGQEWQGRGVTLQGKDTAYVEKMKLIIKEGGIYYIADVVENKQPVYFKFTEISTLHFVCENQAHDFPKKIAYRKDGGVLKATISGNGKSKEYVFRK